MATPKVIVLGSLQGKLREAFSKLATLHAKNGFSFAMLVGNVFGSDDDEQVAELLNGNITVPLTTYFSVGTSPLPPAIVARLEADQDICENLHFLGKRSITKTTDSVRIVSLGGLLDPQIVGGTSKEQHLPFHTADDAKSLKGANSADILLTTLWPQNIWFGSKVALGRPPTEIPSSDLVADLCAALKPRYHFAISPGEFFFEREAFFHPNKDEHGNESVTRFISIAPFLNSAKAKAMYAFSLPARGAVVETPVGTTSSPLIARLPKRPLDNAGFSRFSDGAGPRDRHGGGRFGHKRRRDRSPPPGPDRCYFCLSNPNLPTHMVTTIGEECYLVTAKGPLPTSTQWQDSGLEFPGHMLIVPLAHEPTMRRMTSEESPEGGVKTYKELIRFRESLEAMVSARSQYKLGAVSWEISRERNIHLHWQFMPVPLELAKGGLVEAAFRVEAENFKYPSFKARDLSYEELADMGDYLRVWIWFDDGVNKLKNKCLVMQLNPEDRFDLQFARRVMAKLLGLDARLAWQDVAQSEEDETKDVAAFRVAFKDWDFTLRDN